MRRRRSHFYFASILTLLLTVTFPFQAHAAPAGPLIMGLSSFFKWTARSSSKAPQSDGNVLQFEDGYLVETVVEGNAIGVVPYKIRVSDDGELYAVDEVNSNIVKITPPLSQYSRARLVAGSFQGYTGHVDGKANEARFNHPKGVTMDNKGNVYVADTLNLAIRKIGYAGVTTIAGGKSNSAGFRDGPSEDAKFSTDFDVVYVHSTCSLLVVDRGNAALRQISLNQEDCDYQSSSITVTDLLMVVGAVFAGYITCMLQQGFGSSIYSKTQQFSEGEFKKHQSRENPIPIAENMKEDPRWPSFGQLLVDLSKFALEVTGEMFLYFIPSWFRSSGNRKGLTPLKDTLRMPEDEDHPLVHRQSVPAPFSETRRAPSWFRSSGNSKGLTPLKDTLRMPDDEVDHPSVHRQSVPVPLSETRQTIPAPISETRQSQAPDPSEKYSEMKPPKIRSTSAKDPSLSSKHRSSKRQEYAEFYGSGEAPISGRTKSHREKTRHRHRDKSGEVASGAVGAEPKPVNMKPMDYENPKFDHFNVRSKYGSNNSYQF